jgi:hypothetical protein
VPSIIKSTTTILLYIYLHDLANLFADVEEMEPLGIKSPDMSFVFVDISS